MTKEKKKQPLNRGAFEYIIRKKQKYVKRLVLYILIGVAIFLFGYFMNKCTVNNIFTVLAILMVLPGAKAFVALVVFWPFQSVSKERYEKVYEAVSNGYEHRASIEEVKVDTVVEKDVCNLLTDVVFTSPEKIMNMDFLVIRERQVLGLVGKEKQKVSYMEQYIKDGLKSRGLPYDFKLYENEEKFLKALKIPRGVDCEAEERTKVVEYLTSLIVL